MGMVDDENDDEEKEGEEKGTREWRTTTEFSLIVLKCFNNQLQFPLIHLLQLANVTQPYI
jgi:hypothetical protein